MSIRSVLCVVFAVLTLSASSTRAGTILNAATPDTDKPQKASWFKDPEDGCLDVSGFLDRPFGFIPVPLPITEPAIGLGGAVAAVFINQDASSRRPDLYGVGAMRTSNGTDGYFAGHSGHYLNDRLQVLAAAIKASVNLDFHGIGRQPRLEREPLRYNLDITGGGLGTNWQIGDSHWHVGVGYGYAEVRSSFVRSEERERLLAGVPGNPLAPKTTVSGVRLALGHDSRDNIFTPTKGWFTELSVGASAQAIGSSADFQIIDWVNIWYQPIVREKLFFGVFSDVRQGLNDVPFFLRPAIALRGVPMQRYQGDGMACAEGELRWQFSKRWSLVGFAGAGMTWTGNDSFGGGGETIVSGGGGFRYLIARRYGLHMGIDAAWSKEDSAVYIQFGSAWARP